MILTYQQFMDHEYASLRAEYPDAEPKDIREMVRGASRRQDWVDDVTASMRIGVPSRQQWPHIIRELGAMYIWRRVFHDAPGTDARYLAAGLVLSQIAAEANDMEESERAIALPSPRFRCATIKEILDEP